jgi:hypothetical protein
MNETDLWLAHEQPDRPLAYGAWLCDCELCFQVLAVSEDSQPGIHLVLKTGMDRLVISAAEALAAHIQGRSLDCFLRHPDDWLREVFVARDREHLPSRRLRRSPRLRLVK